MKNNYDLVRMVDTTQKIILYVGEAIRETSEIQLKDVRLTYTPAVQRTDITGTVLQWIYYTSTDRRIGSYKIKDVEERFVYDYVPWKIFFWKKPEKRIKEGWVKLKYEPKKIFSFTYVPLVIIQPLDKEDNSKNERRINHLYPEIEED